MADVTINGLSAGAISGTDEIEYQIAGGGASRKTTATAIASLSKSNTAAYTKNQYVTPVTNAAVSGSYAPDASASNNFQLTLIGNLTLANPTNLQAGMVLNFCLDEDSTGGRTISFGSMYKWPGGFVPMWATSASAKNFFSAYYDGSLLRCSGSAGYA